MIPEISVLMPVFNGERYLAGAIECVLAQTFRNFELLIVDDGSTDGSRTIAEQYLQQDSRVVLHAEPHRGLIGTLNRGLDIARGRYIARMDSDDLAYPHWLATIYRFMENHSEVGICGGWTRIITDNRSLWKQRYPIESSEIRCELLFGCMFCHPTVLIRRDQLCSHRLFYNVDFPHAEDYELWVRAAEHFALANVPKVVTRYRIHASQVSQIHNAKQAEGSLIVIRRQLALLGIEPTPEEWQIHRALHQGQLPEQFTSEFLWQGEAWLLRILETNSHAHRYNQQILSKVISARWMALCYRTTRLGMDTWHYFWGSRLAKSAHVSPLWRVKFFARCIQRI